MNNKQFIWEGIFNRDSTIIKGYTSGDAVLDDASQFSVYFIQPWSVYKFFLTTASPIAESIRS